MLNARSTVALCGLHEYKVIRPLHLKDRESAGLYCYLLTWSSGRYEAASYSKSSTLSIQISQSPSQPSGRAARVFDRDNSLFLRLEIILRKLRLYELTYHVLYCIAQCAVHSARKVKGQRPYLGRSFNININVRGWHKTKRS